MYDVCAPVLQQALLYSLAESSSCRIHLLGSSLLCSASSSLVRLVGFEVLKKLSTAHCFTPAQRGEGKGLGRLTDKVQRRSELQEIVCGYSCCPSSLTHRVMKFSLN